jgi:tyrosyl-tRNA synthetase
MVSSEKILDHFNDGKFYLGIDPTAHSIHIGHLIPISLCIDLLQRGMSGIILVGGFTGQIGDPTDKNETRKVLESQVIKNNSSGILNDLKRIFKPYENKIIFVNNIDWLSSMNMSEYLSLARYISVNKKVNLDTFKRRLDNNQHLSLSEFMYSDLQMIDFLHLYKNYKCNIQVGGQDQWGNISFGVHYVKQITGDENIFGICTPLLLDNGKKVSKSDGKPAFLSSPFDLYQFLYRLSDNAMYEMCALFQVEENREILINKIFSIVYPDESQDILKNTVEKSNLIFKSNINSCPDELIQYLESDKLSKILYKCNLVKSISDAKRQISQGAVYVDNIKEMEDILFNNGKFKLSVGSKKHAFIEIV